MGTGGAIFCGIEKARQFINFPSLVGRSCLDPSCFDEAVITARYAAAYNEHSFGNAQVKFQWKVYDTTSGYAYVPLWDSGWLDLTEAGQIASTPTPADFNILCTDGTITSWVRITTSDGWENIQTQTLDPNFPDLCLD